MNRGVFLACTLLLTAGPRSWTDPTVPRCGLCDAPFGDDSFGGGVDRHGAVDGREICEQCAQDAKDAALTELRGAASSGGPTHE